MHLLVLLVACTGEPVAPEPVPEPIPAPAPEEPAPAPEEPAPAPTPDAVQAVPVDDATTANPTGRMTFTGSYHGSDVAFGNGEAFLGLCGTALESLRAKVTEEFDPMLDHPGQTTGRRVSAPCASGVEPVALFSNLAALAPSPVTPAALGGARFPAPETITWNGTPYVLASEPVQHDGYRLVLSGGGPAVELVSFPSSDDGTWKILWAGDLDRDGALDLLLAASPKYTVSQEYLFLSSAGTTAPLGLVAMHRSVGD